MVADSVRWAGREVIRRKGATNHAIGMVTADLLRCILRNERRVLTVSRVQDGASGFGNVAMSLPAVVGVRGAVHVIVPEMSLDEREQLEHSAAVLRAASGH